MKIRAFQIVTDHYKGEAVVLMAQMWIRSMKGGKIDEDPRMGRWEWVEFAGFLLKYPNAHQNCENFTKIMSKELNVPILLEIEIGNWETVQNVPLQPRTAGKSRIRA